MALRDQPYIPFYVDDFLTDEKLNECSASATGVYIRLLCIMHKSKDYGKILLKQNNKQTENRLLNFANKLAKHMPYNSDEIKNGLDELLNEEVIYLEGDYLCQKRMIKDNELSIKRSEAGKKGGKSSGFAKAKIKANGKANGKANYVYVNEDVIVNVYEYINSVYPIQIENFKIEKKIDIQKICDDFVHENVGLTYNGDQHLMNALKKFIGNGKYIKKTKEDW